jgi:hypothetical protein
MKPARLWLVAVLLGSLLTLVPPAAAQEEGPRLQHTDIGWHANYFATKDLSGAVALSRTDRNINFDWGTGSPGPGVPADRFSVRWIRTIEFEGGNYRFTVVTDDGFRLYVDGRLILDKWIDQPSTTYTVDIGLVGGHHTVVAEYYENTGGAIAKLSWRRLTELGVEVIVDELSEGFTWGGPLSGQREAQVGWVGHTFYTRNARRTPENYGKWTPILPTAGNYQVYAFIPSRYANSRSVRYRIFHNGVRNDKVINQSWYSNQWVSLGTYYFDASNDGSEFVIVYDNTGEAYLSRYIAFDAVKFVKR